MSTSFTCEVTPQATKCWSSSLSWWASTFSARLSTLSGGLGKYSNQCWHQFTAKKQSKTLKVSPIWTKSLNHCQRDQCASPNTTLLSYTTYQWRWPQLQSRSVDYSGTAWQMGRPAGGDNQSRQRQQPSEQEQTALCQVKNEKTNITNLRFWHNIMVGKSICM